MKKLSRYYKYRGISIPRSVTLTLKAKRVFRKIRMHGNCIVQLRGGPNAWDAKAHQLYIEMDQERQTACSVYYMDTIVVDQFLMFMFIATREYVNSKAIPIKAPKQ
jgi:hypothetical protein